VRPASVVFQTPPLFGAMKKTFVLPGTPEAATVRPPRKGPIILQRISPNRPGGNGCAKAGRATRKARARKRDGVRSCVMVILRAA
jgi:hypothetical protein